MEAGAASAVGQWAAHGDRTTMVEGFLRREQRSVLGMSGVRSWSSFQFYALHTTDTGDYLKYCSVGGLVGWWVGW